MRAGQPPCWAGGAVLPCRRPGSSPRGSDRQKLKGILPEPCPHRAPGPGQGSSPQTKTSAWSHGSQCVPQGEQPPHGLSLEPQAPCSWAPHPGPLFPGPHTPALREAERQGVGGQLADPAREQRLPLRVTFPQEVPSSHAPCERLTQPAASGHMAAPTPAAHCHAARWQRRRLELTPGASSRKHCSPQRRLRHRAPPGPCAPLRPPRVCARHCRPRLRGAP